MSDLPATEAPRKSRRRLKAIRGQAERNEIVEANLKLTYHAAIRAADKRSIMGHATSVTDIEDLAQTAAVRLIERAESFDPDKGELSTHAYQTMLTYLRSEAYECPHFTMSAQSQADHSRLRRGRRSNPGLTDAELGERFGWTPCRLALALEVERVKGLEKADIGHAERSVAKWDDVGVSDAKMDAITMLLALDPSFLVVILLSFGLAGEAPMTDEEIGMRMGRMRASVQRTRLRAIEILRELFDRSED